MENGELAKDLPVCVPCNLPSSLAPVLVDVRMGHCIVIGSSLLA